MDYDNAPIEHSKDYLKYQLFSVLEQLPKPLRNTNTLCQIVESLMTDIVCFSADEALSAQQRLQHTMLNLEQRLDKLSTISVDKPVH